MLIVVPILIHYNKLTRLDLDCYSVEYYCLDDVVPALIGSKLQVLNLCRNPSISVLGL